MKKVIIFDLDEMINFIKQENETLSEQYYNLESKLRDTQKAKTNINKVFNTEIKQMFEKIMNQIDSGQKDKSNQDMGQLYKFISDLIQTIQDYQDPNELNFDSHNNSNINNIYFEDDSKKSSYITLNYEKFKQQQQEKKELKGSNSTNNSFVNKSNIVQNLQNKTPNKYPPNTQNTGNQIKNINPNPLTAHLKNNSNNDKYVNKFLLNSNK